MAKYFTAIIICVDTATGEISGKKYRNIRNVPASLAKFEAFAAKQPGAREINYYSKESRKFALKTTLGYQHTGKGEKGQPRAQE